MGWPPPHKRMKPRYNPRPNAEERAYHKRLLEMSCVCCERPAECVHHILQDAPFKRWRRDHFAVVPMADVCHKSLHARGSEASWCEERGIDVVEIAERLRLCHTDL